MNHLTKKIFMNQKTRKKELRHMEILNGDQTESKIFFLIFFMKFFHEIFDVIFFCRNSRRPPTDEIVPVFRRDCHLQVHAGSHQYPGSGIYLLKFDNSYSLWRSKEKFI